MQLRRGPPLAATRRRRRGSGGGGSDRHPRPEARACPAGRAPCGRAASGARDVRLAGVRAWTAPRWNSRPSTEPASSTFRSCAPSWSSRAASRAWIVGGTMTSPSRDSRTSATICSTKSGLPSAASRTRCAEGVVEVAEAGDEAIGVVGIERLEQHGRRVELAPAPGRPRSSSSGRAMQTSRIGASRDRSATCSTRSRNVASPQCTSSKTHTRGRVVGGALEELANRPGDLVGGACVAVWPSRLRIASPASPSSSTSPSCFTTSTTGQ